MSQKEGELTQTHDTNTCVLHATQTRNTNTRVKHVEACRSASSIPLLQLLPKSINEKDYR
jgi:hypothetical protein